MATKGAARVVVCAALCISALGVTIFVMQTLAGCSFSPAIEAPARFEAGRIWTDEKALRSLRIERVKLRRRELRKWKESLRASVNALLNLCLACAQLIARVPLATDAITFWTAVGDELSMHGWRALKLALAATQVFLLFVLCGACVSGDMPAGGACVLWMFGVHANTTVSCSAFTMLVMLSLDASFCSLEFKIALCAMGAVTPLFPPKQSSTARGARAHAPLIVEALEFQQPEAEIDGGEIVCDEPPRRSRAPATGQESATQTHASSKPPVLEAKVECGEIVYGKPPLFSTPAAGHAKPSAKDSQGCETVSLPGLNVQWPFSQLILSGDKTVEVRPYALGWRNIGRPGVEMWLVETPGEASAVSKRWALPCDAPVAPRPKHAQIVGTVVFCRSR